MVFWYFSFNVMSKCIVSVLVINQAVKEHTVNEFPLLKLPYHKGTHTSLNSYILV